MITIKYRDWELIVDKKLTEQTYEKIEISGVESCNCNYCKNFANNRENIYPKEIKELLTSIGIDYRKECEVWHYCKDEFGRHCYSGWFHFKGKFKGKSLSAPTPDTTTTYDLTPISDTFSLGFLYDSSLTFFEDKEYLVQVEFDAKTTWTISEDDS
ncbi:MAG: hypothetical protein ACOVOW_14585 [Spirosomataceae bacterium]